MGRMSLNSKLSCVSANRTIVDFFVEATRLGVDCRGRESDSSSRSSLSMSIAGSDGSDGSARSSAACILRQTREGVSNTGIAREPNKGEAAPCHPACLALDQCHDAVLGPNNPNFTGLFIASGSVCSY
jgi:hypothetical protein